ncbi:MAG: NAD-dependent epimerase/dehydratase family protein [Pseudonocardia sp.]|uniref:NAD-dependent epimerase/dehydratase family protein n=1 Tax=unclassified Pseudonocardia TaxID=2619320 RepID=UPI00086DC502|nr:MULTISPECIES: NAD-dependent epimerase/dehydratase family protein [unclassified Pseudonocardia]MBN9107285.1 NAD-dependent epimerase/dehydratase family protein [Pseudonocardia sp.]ODU27026.1 MAG: NAD-dependent epimerase [Pseudonocardia sp. SCN 72-51]ODV06541.1 MAG: NAD-dependent epimerase [Pseudonocardia sp. SCN 73-27]
MRVVVTGATGNLGSGVLRALSQEPAVDALVGVARRPPDAPDAPGAGVEWVRADVATDDLTDVLRGADALVHLAWLFQPTHDPVLTWRVNVLGSLAVYRAAAEAGVAAVVHASSVGAYSARPDVAGDGPDRPVGEDWPTHGWPGAAYTREKAYLERALDGWEAEHPGTRLVRLRPSFVFRQEAAVEQRRLFAGPFVPQSLLRPGRLPMLPDIPGLRFQAVHSDDVGEAVRLAVTGDARGAFNLAGDPVVDMTVLAGLLRARLVRVPAGAARAALAAAWHLRLAPAAPGLFDAVLRLPVMDTGRARDVLGWTPQRSSTEALSSFFAGLAAPTGPTPALDPDTGGPARLGEIGSGVGGRP